MNDGTVLAITAVATTGFDLSKITVNGNTLSGNQYTIQSNVEIESVGVLILLNDKITTPQTHHKRTTNAPHNVRKSFCTHIAPNVYNKASKHVLF